MRTLLLLSLTVLACGGAVALEPEADAGDAGAQDAGFCWPVTERVCHPSPLCPDCGGDAGCQWVTHPCP